MKKFVVLLLLGIFIASPAMARGKKHHIFHHHKGYYASDITAGIIGTTVGVLIADELIADRHKHRKVPARPRVYMAEPEKTCYTIVSRKTGKVRQECVENASDKIIYVD